NVISFFSGIENAASARSYGVEIEAQALLTDNWTVGGGIGYLNAKFKDYDNAFVENQIVDLSGALMPNAPKWTINANTEYSFPIFNEYEGFVRAEWYYRDNIVADKRGLIFEGFPWEVPSYHVTNLRAGFDAENY